MHLSNLIMCGVIGFVLVSVTVEARWMKEEQYKTVSVTAEAHTPAILSTANNETFPPKLKATKRDTEVVKYNSLHLVQGHSQLETENAERTRGKNDSKKTGKITSLIEGSSNELTTNHNKSSLSNSPKIDGTVGQNKVGEDVTTEGFEDQNIKPPSGPILTDVKTEKPSTSQSTSSCLIITSAVLLIICVAELAMLLNLQTFSCTKCCNVVTTPASPWEEEVRYAQFHAQVSCVAAGLQTELPESKNEEKEKDEPQQVLLQDTSPAVETSEEEELNDVVSDSFVSNAEILQSSNLGIM
eukprot:jgi/Bigna1/84889/estExt_fgenesh1_pg.C_10294